MCGVSEGKLLRGLLSDLGLASTQRILSGATGGRGEIEEDKLMNKHTLFQVILANIDWIKGILVSSEVSN